MYNKCNYFKYSCPFVGIVTSYDFFQTGNSKL